MFLRREFSEENILFWRHCNNFRSISTDDKDGDGLREERRRQLARYIYDEFIDDRGLYQVNVEDDTRRDIKDRLQLDAAAVVPDSDLFSAAQHHIYRLMKTDSYPRFVISPIYLDYLAAAGIDNQDHRQHARRGRCRLPKLSWLPTMTSSNKPKPTLPTMRSSAALLDDDDDRDNEADRRKSCNAAVEADRRHRSQSRSVVLRVVRTVARRLSVGVGRQHTTAMDINDLSTTTKDRYRGTTPSVADTTISMTIDEIDVLPSPPLSSTTVIHTCDDHVEDLDLHRAVPGRRQISSSTFQSRFRRPRVGLLGFNI